MSAVRDSRAFRLVGLGLRAEVVRRDAVRLGSDELAELNVLAFGYGRRTELEAQRKAQLRMLPQLARQVEPIRMAALVASMGTSGAPVQPWEGVIGAEGKLTGDGRLIDHEALTWARFPLPLRWAAADHGGHDGAVIVGRIDAVQRSGGGMIHAHGVLDLGSPEGREAARLIAGGFLSGVSMDLDSTDSAPGTVSVIDGGGTKTKPAAVTSDGRVRAATLVSIPAFDEARIALVQPDTSTGDAALHNPDCGCLPLTVIHADDRRRPAANTNSTTTTTARRRP